MARGRAAPRCARPRRGGSRCPSIRSLAARSRSSSSRSRRSPPPPRPRCGRPPPGRPPPHRAPFDASIRFVPSAPPRGLRLCQGVGAAARRRRVRGRHPCLRDRPAPRLGRGHRPLGLDDPEQLRRPLGGLNRGERPGRDLRRPEAPRDLRHQRHPAGGALLRRLGVRPRPLPGQLRRGRLPPGSGRSRPSGSTSASRPRSAGDERRSTWESERTPSSGVSAEGATASSPSSAERSPAGTDLHP